MIIAFKKLDSYNKLLKAAVKVTGMKSHSLFMDNNEKKVSGYH